MESCKHLLGITIVISMVLSASISYAEESPTRHRTPPVYSTDQDQMNNGSGTSMGIDNTLDNRTLDSTCAPGSTSCTNIDTNRIDGTLDNRIDNRSLDDRVDDFNRDRIDPLSTPNTGNGTDSTTPGSTGTGTGIGTP